MKIDVRILVTIVEDERIIVVLDELMSEAGKLQETNILFTKWSHHRNMTVVYIVQNVFDKGKVQRNMSLNSHYMVLFNNPRVEGQMRHYAIKCSPTKIKIFMNSFREATKKYP